jgi:hypothetical protein
LARISLSLRELRPGSHEQKLQPAQILRLFLSGSTSEYMHQQRNHRQNQQQVNETARDMKGEPGYAPNPEQHKKQHQKKKISYHARCSLVAMRHNNGSICVARAPERTTITYMPKKKAAEETVEKVEAAAPPAPKPPKVKIPKLAKKDKHRLPRKEKKAKKKAALKG